MVLIGTTTGKHFLHSLLKVLQQIKSYTLLSVLLTRLKSISVWHSMTIKADMWIYQNWSFKQIL